MARLIEFSRRSTAQLKKILTFYDERNESLHRHFPLRCSQVDGLKHPLYDAETIEIVPKEIE